MSEKLDLRTILSEVKTSSESQETAIAAVSKAVEDTTKLLAESDASRTAAEKKSATKQDQTLAKLDEITTAVNGMSTSIDTLSTQLAGLANLSTLPQMMKSNTDTIKALVDSIAALQGTGITAVANATKPREPEILYSDDLLASASTSSPRTLESESQEMNASPIPSQQNQESISGQSTVVRNTSFGNKDFVAPTFSQSVTRTTIDPNQPTNQNPNQIMDGQSQIRNTMVSDQSEVTNHPIEPGANAEERNEQGHLGHIGNLGHNGNLGHDRNIGENRNDDRNLPPSDSDGNESSTSHSSHGSVYPAQGRSNPPFRFRNRIITFNKASGYIDGVASFKNDGEFHQSPYVKLKIDTKRMPILEKLSNAADVLAWHEMMVNFQLVSVITDNLLFGCVVEIDPKTKKREMLKRPDIIRHFHSSLPIDDIIEEWTQRPEKLLSWFSVIRYLGNVIFGNSWNEALKEEDDKIIMKEDQDAEKYINNKLKLFSLRRHPESRNFYRDLLVNVRLGLPENILNVIPIKTKNKNDQRVLMDWTEFKAHIKEYQNERNAIMVHKNRGKIGMNLPQHFSQNDDILTSLIGRSNINSVELEENNNAYNVNSLYFKSDGNIITNPVLCGKCGEENHMMNHCRLGKGEKTIICVNCNGFNHYSNNCLAGISQNSTKRPSTFKKSRSQSFQGSSNRSVNFVKSKSRNDEKKECYNCGQMGHYANKCPTRDPEDIGKTCSICSKMNHIALKCRFNPVNVEPSELKSVIASLLAFQDQNVNDNSDSKDSELNEEESEDERSDCDD